MAQRTVAEHLCLQVAHLDIEAELAMEESCQGGHHPIKERSLVHTRGVHTRPDDSCEGKQIGRKQTAPSAQLCQQVGHHPPLFVSDNHHIRPRASSLLSEQKTLAAMKEVVAFDDGQVLALRDDMDAQLVHAAKIVNVF